MIKLNSKNQSAIKLIKIGGYHAKTKQIDIQLHYVREAYELISADILCQQDDCLKSNIKNVWTIWE